jgi:hypothetical protein
MPRGKKNPEYIGKPPEAVRAFQAQRTSATRRGIPFLFTFTEWWAWWQVDDRWTNRGMGSDKLVMARYGDEGPYSPGNVFCATHAKNLKYMPARWGRPTSPKAMEVFKRRGAERHNSRPVETPAGTFASATLAGEHFGFTRQ